MSSNDKFMKAVQLYSLHEMRCPLSESSRKALTFKEAHLKVLGELLMWKNLILLSQAKEITGVLKGQGGIPDTPLASIASVLFLWKNKPLSHRLASHRLA